MLPANSRVVGGWFRVNAVWDSGTSDDMDIGDGDDDDRYSSTIIPLDGTIGDCLAFTVAGAAATDGALYEVRRSGYH